MDSKKKIEALWRGIEGDSSKRKEVLGAILNILEDHENRLRSIEKAYRLQRPVSTPGDPPQEMDPATWLATTIGFDHLARFRSLCQQMNLGWLSGYVALWVRFPSNALAVQDILKSLDFEDDRTKRSLLRMKAWAEATDMSAGRALSAMSDFLAQEAASGSASSSKSGGFLAAGFSELESEYQALLGKSRRSDEDNQRLADLTRKIQAIANG